MEYEELDKEELDRWDIKTNRLTHMALQSSIIKWERILEKKDVDRGSNNCDLCNLFHSQDHDNACKYCPVKLKTGKQFCDGTPYIRWSTHQNKVHGTNFAHEGHRVQCRYCEKLACEELEFLKSLRPDFRD